ncbi:MAG: MBL fold metallo-hydrolase [Desulfitobacteriaceae bacterium]
MQKGTDGWYLVDTGLSGEDTTRIWLNFFEKQSIRPSDVKGIYITHFHSDHYGCSGWLQNYTGHQFT